MQLFTLNPVYEVTTPPTDDVVTLDEAKGQLRELGEDDDTEIAAYLAAATALVELDSQLLLRSAELTLHLDRFPEAAGAIEISRWPITSIEAIRYVDPDGVEQTLATSGYLAALVARPPQIVPTPGSAWPTTRRQPGAVRIDFAGGMTSEQVPETARQLIRLLVGHWYNNRELSGSVGPEIADAYRWLLDRLEWGA